MNKIEVFEKLSDLIENNFNINKYHIEEESNLREELYLDSFDIAELSVIVEKEYNRVFSDKEVERWEEINDIISTVLKHTNDEN